MLSNIVLDELDNELEKRGHRFVRYADDVSIYVKSKRAGERVFESVKRFLEQRMRLKVNEDKSAVSRPPGRPILGFELRPSMRKKRVELELSDRTRNRLREKIQALTPRTWGKSLRACINQINLYVQGWANYFGVAYWVRKAAQRADEHLRRRLRAILLGQWKSTKRMRANLKRLGTGAHLVNQVSRSTGAWRRSKSQAVNMGLTIKQFERWGLLSFEKCCAARFAIGLPLAETSP